MAAMKVAVVTGANKGIGLSIVKLLCQQQPDWIVYLTARDVQRGNEAVKQLHESFGISPRFHQLDVDSVESVRKFRDFLKEEHPQGISVLINNAGIYFRRWEGPFTFIRENYRKTVATNYFGAVNVCQELFPLLTKDARVVMLSSRLAQSIFSTQCSPKIQDAFRKCSSVDQLNEIMQAFTELPEEVYHSNGWTKSALHEELPSWRPPWKPAVGDLLPYGISKLGLNILTMLYQKKFDSSEETSGVVINTCTPGMVRTAMNPEGIKSPDEGADVPVYLALLPADTTVKAVFVADNRMVVDMFVA